MSFSGLLARVAGVVIFGVGSAAFGATSSAYTTFNVYSLGNIGSSTSAYGSDIGGVVGAAGNVYMSNIHLYGANSTTGIGLYVGGTATLSGSYDKGIEAGGNVSLSSISVYGNVISGGNITGTNGGTVYGNITAFGSANANKKITVTGVQTAHASFTSSIDYAAVSSYFLSQSSQYGAMAATGSVTNEWGNLTFTGQSGLNIVTVDAALLQSAWGFTITAPGDATVVINVTGDTINLDYTGWTYQGGISASHVLLNLPTATTLNLSSTNNVNILAPTASTVFSSGAVTGNLIVGNLTGSGQVNEGYFDGITAGTTPVPEPATAAALLVGGVGLLIRRHARKRVA